MLNAVLEFAYTKMRIRYQNTTETGTRVVCRPTFGQCLPVGSVNLMKNAVTLSIFEFWSCGDGDGMYVVEQVAFRKVPLLPEVERRCFSRCLKLARRQMPCRRV